MNIKKNYNPNLDADLDIATIVFIGVSIIALITFWS